MGRRRGGRSGRHPAEARSRGRADVGGRRGGLSQARRVRRALGPKRRAVGGGPLRLVRGQAAQDAAARAAPRPPGGPSPPPPPRKGEGVWNSRRGEGIRNASSQRGEGIGNPSAWRGEGIANPLPLWGRGQR